MKFSIPWCRVKEFGCFSEKSDIYSFGVFLLELVSGRAAMDLLSSDINQNLVEWVFGSFLTMSICVDVSMYKHCAFFVYLYCLYWEPFNWCQFRDHNHLLKTKLACDLWMIIKSCSRSAYITWICLQQFISNSFLLPRKMTTVQLQNLF